MDREIYEQTIKTNIDDISGPVENPGLLVETDVGPSQNIATIVLDRSIVIVGSDEAADVEIKGKSVASYHAEIVHDDGEYSIRHLEGSAPVRVNGVAVSESMLAEGDVIAIGDKKFTFQRQTQLEAPE